MKYHLSNLFNLRQKKIEDLENNIVLFSQEIDRLKNEIYSH